MRRNRLDQHVERALVALVEAENSLKILEEQVAAWSEMRDDLKTRSLVSETPLAAAEFNEMERQLSVAQSALDRQSAEVLVRRARYEDLLEDWQPEGEV